MKTLRILLLCAAALGSTLLPAHSQGTAFTYQGVLSQAGVAQNGLHDFTFTLYNAATDGQAVGTPNAVEGLRVADGVFTAILDFGPDAFVGQARWLQIAVRPTGSDAAPAELSPRTPVQPAPYAIFAATSRASGITGKIGPEQIAVGAIGPSHITTTAGLWDRVDNNLFHASGNVGIGIDQPMTSIGYPVGWEGLHTRSAQGSGLNIIQGADSARLHLRVDKNLPGVAQDFIIANNANQIDFMWLGAGLGNRLSALTIAANGNVGVGTTTPSHRLEVVGGIRASAFIGDGSGLTGISATNLLDVVPEPRLPASVARREGGNTFAGTQIVNGGRVGIGTDQPSTALHLVGAEDTELSIQSAANNRRWTLQASGGTDAVGLGGSFQVIDRTAFAARMVITAQGNMGIGTSSPTERLEVGGNIRANGSISVHDGAGATKASLLVDANGKGQMVCDYIQINGGADLAEPFQVRGDTPIEPGMIVAIDPERPGELRISQRAYDPTVAGIVSGANGIRPGLMLQQDGTIAAGRHPVALSGRVWCHADADSGGEITPGDLLTSANVPGHAMRAGDRNRAFGAILGKAMTPLKKGRGLVLVLVSLQ